MIFSWVLWLSGIIRGARAFAWFIHSSYKFSKEASTSNSQETKLACLIHQTNYFKNLLVTSVTTKRIYYTHRFYLLICFQNSAIFSTLSHLYILNYDWLSRSKIHILIYLLGFRSTIFNFKFLLDLRS